MALLPIVLPKTMAQKDGICLDGPCPVLLAVELLAEL